MICDDCKLKSWCGLHISCKPVSVKSCRMHKPRVEDSASLPQDLSEWYEQVPILTKDERDELGCAVENAMDEITEEDKLDELMEAEDYLFDDGK